MSASSPFLNKPLRTIGSFLGQARYALIMWRKHRAELARLQGLRSPQLIAAE